MNYAIRKPRDDLRKHTCGMYTPNGKVNVVELTLYNCDQLRNLINYGYIVEETTMDPGIYDEVSYEGGVSVDSVKAGIQPAQVRSSQTLEERNLVLRLQR